LDILRSHGSSQSSRGRIIVHDNLSEYELFEYWCNLRGVMSSSLHLKNPRFTKLCSQPHAKLMVSRVYSTKYKVQYVSLDSRCHNPPRQIVLTSCCESPRNPLWLKDGQAKRHHRLDYSLSHYPPCAHIMGTHESFTSSQRSFHHIDLRHVDRELQFSL
jgi:hypothetical protein